ncbi:MAG: DUF3108 domain-containing protein, partial [Bacteroidales bacterium]|nr:DUF3108 domain-containing protein [Bacteroidales bacterium]
WFSRADFRPLECRRENGDGAFDHYIYDWDANAIHAKVCMDGKQTIEMDIPVHKNVYDLSTIVFYIRSLGDRTLKPGVSMPVSFVMDTTVYDIKLTYIGRQSLTAPDGTEISTKNYSCSVVDGALFKGDTPIRFWFTDDRRPVLAAVMLPLRVGAVWGWNAAFRN